MVPVIYLDFVRRSLQSAWVVLNDVWAFLEVLRWFLGGRAWSLRVSKRSLWVLIASRNHRKIADVFSDAKMASVVYM